MHEVQKPDVLPKISLDVVGEYDLITNQEQQQLRDWNATEADFPRDRCLQDLFEEQVARAPQAVADSSVEASNSSYAGTQRTRQPTGALPPRVRGWPGYFGRAVR